MTLRSWSYSMRFALLLSVVFSVATIVAGVIAVFVQSEELKTRLFQDAQFMVENLGTTLTNHGYQNFLDQITAQVSISPDNSVLVSFWGTSTGEVMGNLHVKTPFVGNKKLLVGQDIVLSGLDDEDNNGEFFGYGLKTSKGWIMAARDSRWITGSQEVLVQSVLWSLGVALFLSVGLALVLARHNEERIQRLEVVLDGVAEGDLTLRYVGAETENDDISRVAQGVNVTLDHLEQSMKNLRQVSTDIAHDLRAPLTRVRLKLEPHALLAKLPDDALADIGRAIAEIDDISATFDAILRLARLESGAMNFCGANVDLIKLTSSLYEMLAPVATDLGHDFKLNVQRSSLIISGDEELLSQAVINLADNAFRHCPSGSAVILSVGTHDDCPYLTVCDNGAGIPQKEWDQVTKRFYRLDKSRNKPGTGLGLSLVLAISRLHGAELSFSDNEPGFCATLRFVSGRAI